MNICCHQPLVLLERYQGTDPWDIANIAGCACTSSGSHRSYLYSHLFEPGVQPIQFTQYWIYIGESAHPHQKVTGMH